MSSPRSLAEPPRSLLQGSRAWRWALLAALPTILIFMFFQRYLVGGLTTGAVKG